MGKTNIHIIAKSFNSIEEIIRIVKEIEKECPNADLSVEAEL